MKLIDTPGFADNRLNIRAEVLIVNICKTVYQARDGVNFVGFCILGTKLEIENEILEIKMLADLFGKGVY